MTAIDPRIRAQIDAHETTATFTRTDERPAVRLEWTLPVTPVLAWELITDPAQLARWSPIVPDRPLTSTGPANAREHEGEDPVDAEVLTADRPHDLVHRWGSDLVTWRLEEADGATRLTLETTVGDREMAAMTAAGWHVCLATLSALTGGADVPRVVGEEAMAYGFESLRDRYAAVLGR